jgi:electron transport complex protein RnfD
MSADANTKSPAPPEDATAEAQWRVSAAPHIREPESIPRIMWAVSFALLPAAACGLAVFGPRVLWILALSIIAAVAAEAACQKWRGRPITISDGSAVLTGLLVAFVLPVHVPWYVPVTASVFAVAVVKQAFGGLGCNIWNPALMGRAFVLASWAALVTVGSGWPVPYHHQMEQHAGQGAEAAVDTVTAATPLTMVKTGIERFNKGKTGDLAAPTRSDEAAEALAAVQEETATPLRDLFVGRVGGCIGEVSALALLIGGAALIVLGYVRWFVPVLYIGTVAFLGWMLPIPVQGEASRYLVWFAGRPLFEIFAGGLFLGAFFMATDMVTSPVTRRGQVIFAIGCGVLTAFIRRYGDYPEGVAYSILLMNTAVPLIDRHTRPRVFGREEAPS